VTISSIIDSHQSDATRNSQDCVMVVKLLSRVHLVQYLLLHNIEYQIDAGPLQNKDCLYLNFILFFVNLIFNMYIIPESLCNVPIRLRLVGHHNTFVTCLCGTIVTTGFSKHRVSQIVIRLSTCERS